MDTKRVIAKAINVKGSARKARIPADVVRGMNVDEALAVLEYMPKYAAKDVAKVIASARANAVHNYNLDGEKLKVDKIYVGIGMRLKRMKPKSRGMGRIINKHFCNITVELVEEREDAKVEKTIKSKASTKKEEKAEVKAEKTQTKAKSTTKSSTKKTTKTVKSNK
ncbi:50S ribosomal protein L22 [Candidatus Dojkabacteria bacterium]|uniref:Large ribosomal subunit protein uL22 n=1 Tax=Candidatus Dojkabacteria bacterium TaxID=2099670 RepID=A0A955LAR0_9BACT|nr:50S ribosomal protein L22 [Candidatus Dojkabacteria bacterium]